MSLTSILSSSHYLELKNKLREYFPRPNFKLEGNLIANPQSKNYATIGAAFDYLLRFHLERINNEKTIKQSWVATSAFDKVERYLVKESSSEIERTFDGFENDEIKKEVEDFLNALDKKKKEENLIRFNLINSKYKSAETHYNLFIENGVISDELIISTIFLGKLDLFVRAGLLDDTILEFDMSDVSDLRTLISIVPFQHFTAVNKCYLNPTFGEGSHLVGGADADIIIDDTLYDFKVTKNLKLEREQLNQIIGYYLLSRIGGINDNEDDKPVKNIGIYFARHGIVIKFAISDFNSADNIEKFISWFIDYMKENDPFKLTIEKINKMTSLSNFVDGKPINAKIKKINL